MLIDADVASPGRAEALVKGTHVTWTRYAHQVIARMPIHDTLLYVRRMGLNSYRSKPGAYIKVVRCPNFSRPRWQPSLCFDTCYFHFPHQLATRQQAFYIYRIYTMHSIQPAEHLHSLIKTKNRCLLRDRGLITEDLTFYDVMS